MAAVTLAESLTVEEVAPGEFVSTHLPARHGHIRPIAYGGCTIGLAVSAASRTVEPAYNLYSVLGHFLGPTLTDRKLTCRVHRLRDTRTFATRRVDATQTLANGETRLCLSLVADFHIGEPSIIEYSAPPTGRYSDVSECPTTEELAARLVAQGHVSEALVRAQPAHSSAMASYFENRFCPEGIWGQNLGGLASKVPTTQDHLHITSKTSGDWFRAIQPLATKGEQWAALTFMMDAGPSFMPLIHDHKSIAEAAATSTLDFALRIFVPDVDITGWHLRERMTTTARVARNYAESQLWAHDGTMVASMTQQCIIRPMPPLNASL